MVACRCQSRLKCCIASTIVFMRMEMLSFTSFGSLRRYAGRLCQHTTCTPRLRRITSSQRNRMHKRWLWTCFWMTKMHSWTRKFTSGNNYRPNCKVHLFSSQSLIQHCWKSNSVLEPQSGSSLVSKTTFLILWDLLLKKQTWNAPY